MKGLRKVCKGKRLVHVIGLFFVKGVTLHYSSPVQAPNSVIKLCCIIDSILRNPGRENCTETHTHTQAVHKGKDTIDDIKAFEWHNTQGINADDSQRLSLCSTLVPRELSWF